MSHPTVIQLDRSNLFNFLSDTPATDQAAGTCTAYLTLTKPYTHATDSLKHLTYQIYV